MGTGDGRYVLDRAGREPRSLVVGIDANEASMRQAARRAWSKPARGGRSNALFVVAAAEDLGEFTSSADEVCVQFPWGSLLRGVLGLDPRVLRSIAGVLKPGARLTVLVSLAERDGVAMPAKETLCHTYREAGLELESIESIYAAAARAIRSTWARRLGAGKGREVCRIVARR